MQKVKYSIVMPVYLREPSHKEVVLNTLLNIKENSDDSELIIIDDGSTEMTGFLREFADTYVRQPNQGIGRAWEAGRLLSQGEYVVFVNDDILVPKGWLKILSDGFENERTGVTAPAKGHFTIKEPRLLEKQLYEDHKFYPGYCFMLKRDRFFEEHDARFRTNCGDADYWQRIREKDLYCMRVGFEIYHKEGDTLKKMDYKKISEDSIKLFEEKHGFNPQKEYYG